MTDLPEYLEQQILPQYDAFDKGHQRDHARYVMQTALELAQYYDVDRDMLLVAAACHDIGLCEDRKTHHLVSGRMIRADKKLLQWFTPEQIEIIAQAAEDHRASSDHEPRTIYGKIIAEADRQIIPEVVIRRTIQFTLKHYPDLDREGNYLRLKEHMAEKYAEGGYLKLWIPQSSNAARLQELREIIADEKRLRQTFDTTFSELVG